MVKRTLLFLILFNMGGIVSADAAPLSPQGIVLQGTILTPAGVPVVAASVAFTIEIRSSNIDNCLLYLETHTLNMSGSGGAFTLTIGSGVRATGDFHDTSTIAQVFTNTATAMTPLTCATAATSYTPASGDSRKVVITFDDGDGPQTLTQTLAVQAAPYALYADKLEGKAANEFIQVNTSSGKVLSQANLESVFASSGNMTELMALINGTSGSFSGGASPTFSGAVTASGGIQGSAASGGDLTIDSTSHATKGDILLAPTGGNVGIGTATPGAVLDVKSTTSPQLRATYDSSNYMTTSVGGGGMVMFDAVGFGSSFNFDDMVTIQENSSNNLTALKIDRTLNDLGALNEESGILTNIIRNSASPGLSDKVFGSQIDISRTGASTTSFREVYGSKIQTVNTGATSGSVQSYGIVTSVSGDTNGNSWAMGGSFSAGGADTVYGINTTVTSAAGGTATGLVVDAGTGPGTEYAATFMNGNVGIGTTTPGSTLTVSGSIFSDGGSTSRVSSATDTVTPALNLQVLNSAANGGNGLGAGITFWGEISNGALGTMGSINSLWTDATVGSRTAATTFMLVNNAGIPAEMMRISGNGNVGIGTTTPKASLEIAGTQIITSAGPTSPTTLAVALNNSATTITVGSAASYPSTGTLWIDREAITYTGKTATTFTGATRGAFGTFANTHSIGAGAKFSNLQINSGSSAIFSYNSDGSMKIGTLASAGGEGAIALGSADASGYGAVAFGSSLASGTYATAMGYCGTLASGQNSTGMGCGTIASGLNSTAMGGTTTASGILSLSAGYNTTADSYVQTTIGQYNLPTGTEAPGSWVWADPLFVVGNGTGSGASRSNAMVILKNGGVGIGTNTPNGALDVNGPVKLGTSGNRIDGGIGGCKIESQAITNTAATYTCTGVPASIEVAINCNGSAAMTSPNNSSVYCRASGVANQVICNTTQANSVNMTWMCSWTHMPSGG